MPIRNRYAVQCPVRLTLSVINGKWKAIILYLLQLQPRRFGEFRQCIPEVSQKVLTEQLRELEEDGIIGRRVLDEIPPKVEYYLSDFGKTLEPVLEAISNWGMKHSDIVTDDENINKMNEIERQA